MKATDSPTSPQGLCESAALARREAQALRARVRLLRETMQRARLDYLQALLSLRSMQGNSAACDRITRQLKNLLNEQRPRKLRKGGAALPASGGAGGVTPSHATERRATPRPAASRAPARRPRNPALTRR